jgi:hypothetical protein
VADHLGLDLDLVELLAGVDTDDAANHLGDNDHVTEVSLDEVGLLVGLGLLLGLAELLDETHGLALETAVEPSAGTGVDEVTELLRAEIEEPVSGSVPYPLPTTYSKATEGGWIRGNVLVEVDATVRELSERSLPLKLCTSFRQPMFRRKSSPYLPVRQRGTAAMKATIRFSEWIAAIVGGSRIRGNG